MPDIIASKEISSDNLLFRRVILFHFILMLCSVMHAFSCGVRVCVVCGPSFLCVVNMKYADKLKTMIAYISQRWIIPNLFREQASAFLMGGSSGHLSDK